MRSLPLPVRAVGLFAAMTAWLMVIAAVLGSDGLDAEGVATALKVAATTVVGLVVLDLGLARRHPAVTVPLVGVVVAAFCLAFDLVLTQVDVFSVFVAVVFAVIVVLVTGGEVWWARSGRRGVATTR